MITYEYVNPNDYIVRADKSKHDPEDLTRLWAQMSLTPRTIDLGTIMTVAILSHLFVVRDGQDRIQAMATLCVAPTLHGTIGFIEDVVVDESLRGQHVGEGLMRRLIRLAKNSEVSRIELTSKPKRVAANRLYQKLGFQLRPNDTNHYTLPL